MINQVECFPQFLPLEIGHREMIEKYLQSINPSVSELNFTEIFARRKIRDTTLAVHNGNLLLYLKKDGMPYFYPPFGENEPFKTVAAVLEYISKENEQVAFYGFKQSDALLAERSGNLVSKRTGMIRIMFIRRMIWQSLLAGNLTASAIFCTGFLRVMSTNLRP